MIMSILKLRKRLYRNNGSVLFVVLVVMSMLIIAATATFYVVNNQAASIEVHYTSEQAYQTAKSMSDTVRKYLDGQFEAMEGVEDLTPYQNTLAYKMMKMDTSTPIVASSIDLSALNLGEVKNITITKVGEGDGSDDKSKRAYYEIAISAEVEVNGAKETSNITQVRYIETGTTEYFTRFLTSTGKRGEDVLFSAGEVYGEAYFENPYTEFTQGNTQLNESVYCSGGYCDKGIAYNYPAGSNKEMIIRENFLVGAADGSSINVPHLYVGNDMYNGYAVGVGGGKGTTASSNIYVAQNYYKNNNIADEATYFIGGDCHINYGVTTNATYYVNEDLYLCTESGGNQSQGTFYVKGDVYLNSSNFSGVQSVKFTGNAYDQNGNPITSLPANFVKADTSEEIKNALTASNTDQSFNDFTAVESYINSKTTKNVYKKWDAEKYFDDNLRSGAEEFDLADWNMSYQPWTSGWTMPTTTGNAAILKSAPSTTTGQRKMVIDATVDDVYVYLEGRDVGGGRKEFTFGSQSEIVVKGQHSVILVLPEDTDFNFSGDQNIIGQSGLMALCGNQGKSANDYETNQPGAGNLNGFDATGANNAIEVVTDSDGNNLTLINDPSNESSNNIFLVTTGSNNVIDLSGKGLFAGYVYAPNAKMKCDGSSGNLAFFGGMIVGSYTYKNPSCALAFTQPYDYLTGDSDVVGKLISKAMNGGGDPDPDDEELQFKGSSVLGYK